MSKKQLCGEESGVKVSHCVNFHPPPPPPPDTQLLSRLADFVTLCNHSEWEVSRTRGGRRMGRGREREMTTGLALVLISCKCPRIFGAQARGASLSRSTSSGHGYTCRLRSLAVTDFVYYCLILSISYFHNFSHNYPFIIINCSPRKSWYLIN